MPILPPPDVPLPPPPGKVGGWGDKLEATLVRFFGRLLNAAKDALTGVLRAGFELFLEAIEPVLIGFTSPVINMILAQDNVPPELRHILSEIQSGEHQAASLLLNSVGGTAVGSITGSVIGSLLAPLTYQLNRGIQPARLDFGTLHRATMRDRGYIGSKTNELLDQGWTDLQMRIAERAAELRPGVGELVTLWLRKEIDDTELLVRLQEEGVPGQFIDDIKKLAANIPGPGDLVRFALREAWDDAVAARWGYDADFRPEFAAWMEKQGFSADWAQKFWRAHWELPSLGMGYEMFHRNIINPDQLDELMKLLDIPLGWRNKLKDLSYNVPTRVDVRRMREMRVIEREDVKRVHLDLGYNERWAELLTEWVEQEYAPEQKSVTQAKILDGMHRGLIGVSEARAYLEELGLSDDAINYYIALEQAKMADELEKERLKLIERQFKKGVITEIQAREQMATIQLPASQIEYNIQLWRTAIAENTKSPSISRLEDFYLEAIISSDQMRFEMSAAGFASKYINWYMQALDAEAAEKAAAELERARKEEERVQKAREKTAYEEAVAALDVQIAQQNHVIASARQSLNEQFTTEQLDTIRVAIEQLDLEIAALRTEITRQRDLEQSSKDELAAYISEIERERLESIIESAEVEIVRLAEEQAIANLAIRRLQEERLITPRPTRPAEIDQEIAEHRVEIARLSEEQASLRVAIRILQEEKLTATELDRLQAITEEIAAHQTEIARLVEESEGHEVEIRLLQEELTVVLAADRMQQIDEAIAAHQTEIAESRQAVAAQRSIQEQARADLRAKVPDDVRQRLERQQRDARAAIRQANTEIAELREQQESFRLALAESITADDRRELEEQIDGAKTEIARLRIEKAKLRLD